MKKINNTTTKIQNINSALDIEFKTLDDGSKILKMGSNIYEFPIAFPSENYKKSYKKVEKN